MESKELYLLKKGALMLALFAACISVSFVQNPKQTAAATQKILYSKRYIFRAETATPLRGTFLQLTSIYDLRVKGDTLISFLPYFGRAYSAPMSIDDEAIKFTSVNYMYDIKKNRKNGWTISFMPKDTRNVRQLLLTVSDNGRSTLMVTSNSRDRITFDGYISETKPGK